MLVETIIKTIWKPIFFKTFYCSHQKSFLCLVKNNFVHLSDIPGCEERFSSFQLVETDFLSSGNRILSLRVLLKFLKFKCSNIFLRETLFRLVETDFLAKLFFFFFFFHFSDTPPKINTLPSGNVFLNEFFIPYGGDGFSVL